MRRTNKHRRRTPKRESIAPLGIVAATDSAGASSASFDSGVPSRVPTLAPPPPVLMPPAEHVEDTFFRASDDGAAETPDETAEEGSDEARIAERLARRRRFTRVARIVVALSGIVCALAFVRVVVKGNASASVARASARATAAVTVPPPPVVPKEAAKEVASAESTAPEIASAPVAARGLPLGFDRAAAKKERAEAQAALEIGDVRRADRAAERAVAHDPSEADGWLLLVAAELELKHDDAANAHLRDCAKEATRGPRGECVALLGRRVPALSP